MNYKALNEKKNDLIIRAESILDDAETNKRELTDAEAQELAEIRDDVKKIKEALKIAEELHEEKKELKEDMDAMDAMDGRACGDNKKREAEEVRAFDAYLRSKVTNERANNLTETDNGAVIPETIANRIIFKVYELCPILERSSKYNAKGKFIIPYYSEDTSAITVAFAEEFVDLESNVGKFTSITLTGYLAGALTLISRSLINNSNFNIVDFVVERMAYSIARFIENVLLNGYTADGETDPSIYGLTAVTNVVTAEAQTAITADELIQLQDSVIDTFQSNAIWIMSRNTRTALRELKDDVGRYLLNDDITAPFGKMLLGKPVYISDNMPEMTAGATAIYYGDMRGLATKFSENLNIQVLREKYATQHAVGVVGWLEFDSNIENAQMISALKMANS